MSVACIHAVFGRLAIRLNLPTLVTRRYNAVTRKKVLDKRVVDVTE